VIRLYYCDICRAQKTIVTTRCRAIEGAPRLCQDCLLSDYHVDTVHNGDNLAALMCTIGGGIEELIRRRGTGENKNASQ